MVVVVVLGLFFFFFFFGVVCGKAVELRASANSNWSFRDKFSREFGVESKDVNSAASDCDTAFASEFDVVVDSSGGRTQTEIFPALFPVSVCSLAEFNPTATDEAVEDNDCRSELLNFLISGDNVDF